MKSAEERHSGKEDICHCKACVKARLDAMKEGARRAAIAVKAQHYSGESNTRHVALNVAQRAILTATEQWTTKDL